MDTTEEQSHAKECIKDDRGSVLERYCRDWGM